MATCWRRALCDHVRLSVPCPRPGSLSPALSVLQTRAHTTIQPRPHTAARDVSIGPPGTSLSVLLALDPHRGGGGTRASPEPRAFNRMGPFSSALPPSAVRRGSARITPERHHRRRQSPAQRRAASAADASPLWPRAADDRRGEWQAVRAPRSPGRLAGWRAVITHRTGRRV